ncbi:MAG TPA: hypothetical protein VGA37_02145 [Gemmatimonadales bacterium]
MRTVSRCIAALVTLAAAGGTAAAQNMDGSTARTMGVGFAIHAGSLGVGADVAFSPTERINLRAGGNFFPFGIDITASGIAYSFDLPGPQFTGMVDFFLTGAFRLSGGAMITDAFTASATPAQSETIGGTTYTPAQLGTLTAAITTRDIAPYLGIGIGNVARSKVGFFMDLGVVFQGSPKVALSSTGAVSAVDLSAEVAEFEDDISIFNVYPLLSLGFSIGFKLGS